MSDFVVWKDYGKVSRDLFAHALHRFILTGEYVQDYMPLGEPEQRILERSHTLVDYKTTVDELVTVGTHSDRIGQARAWLRHPDQCEQRRAALYRVAQEERVGILKAIMLVELSPNLGTEVPDDV